MEMLILVCALSVLLAASVWANLWLLRRNAVMESVIRKEARADNEANLDRLMSRNIDDLLAARHAKEQLAIKHEMQAFKAAQEPPMPEPEFVGLQQSAGPSGDQLP